MTPKEILKQVRDLISTSASDDADVWWYVNRYVYQRLALDERRTKTGIKQRLIRDQTPCHYCNSGFDTGKNIHLHRLDSNKGYSEGNCVLMHAPCHQKHHAEHPTDEDSGLRNVAVLVKQSKRYSNKPFRYWWDITPNQIDGFDAFEAIDFVKKDTGERCSVPVPLLKKHLLPNRQTSRSRGNWGIKVLPDHPNELAFEPGNAIRGDWLFLPVVWLDEKDED